MDEGVDWVIAVRHGEANEELRHSLRSIAANVSGVRDVVIAGYKPDWLGNVKHVDVPQEPARKFENVVRIWRTALAQETLSDRVVIGHDDHFVMRPTTVDELGPWHREPLLDHIAKIRKLGRQHAWQRSLERTHSLLRGAGFSGRIDSYALHLPMTVDRRLMLETYERLGSEAVHRQIMTIHCRMHGIDGIRFSLPCDVKLSGHAEEPSGWRDWPFLSTRDGSFGNHPVGDHIRRQFSAPSIYEADMPGWEPLAGKDELVIMNGYMYRNVNTGDTVTYPRRNGRLDRLSNWRLVGQPEPGSRVTTGPSPRWLDYRGRVFERPPGAPLRMWDGELTHAVAAATNPPSTAVTCCGKRACPTKAREFPAPAERVAVTCPDCLAIGEPAILDRETYD